MHCWARYLFIPVVSVLGIGQMIAACGQKGDLYLPKPEKAARKETVTKVEADAIPQQVGGTDEEQPEAQEGPATASRRSQLGGK